MELRVIACVQPLCGHVTSDFYQLGERGQFSPDDIRLGPTCVPCWERIQARLARDRSPTTTAPMKSD